MSAFDVLVGVVVGILSTAAASLLIAWVQHREESREMRRRR